MLEQRTRNYCMIINVQILLHGSLETVCHVNDSVSVSYCPVNKVDRINSSIMCLQDDRFPRSVVPDLSPVSRQILLQGSMFLGQMAKCHHRRTCQGTSEYFRLEVFSFPPTQGSTLLGMPLPNNALVRKTRYMIFPTNATSYLGQACWPAPFHVSRCWVLPPPGNTT